MAEKKELIETKMENVTNKNPNYQTNSFTQRANGGMMNFFYLQTISNVYEQMMRYNMLRTLAALTNN